jgi:hypothetical protein
MSRGAIRGPANPDPTSRKWTGTGHQVLIEQPPDRVPDYDPRSGDHLWMVLTMYQVDPAAFLDPTRTPILDQKNLLTVQGPGCFHCEQPYTQRLASRRCPGEPR